MADSLYLAAEAARDLQAAGLLAGVLVHGPDGLQTAPVRTTDTFAAQAGFAGAALDSRLVTGRQLFVALPGDSVDGRQFVPQVLAKGHWVLTSTEASWQGLEVPESSGVLLCDDPVAALSRLAHCWRRRQDALVVGVTGTNGKTTTKDFAAALLGAAGCVLATAGNFNNHLGLPVTVLGIRPEHAFAVIEMGASAQNEIRPLAEVAAPRIGIITNASAAHLAQFGSLEGIIAGKGELLDALPEDGAAILNADSPGFGQWSERAQCRVVSVGQSGGEHRWSWSVGESGLLDGSTLILDGVSWPVPLPGRHNAANLAAAILAAKEAGLTDESIAEGLGKFQGSAHRGVLLEIGGRFVLDDCYNANPTSMAAAAEAVAGIPGSGRIIAVLGHMAELGPGSEELHEETGSRVAAAAVEILVTVGVRAAGLARGFEQEKKEAHACADIAEAADWLARHSRAGDRILVKGSRSAGLEKLLVEITELFGKDQGD